MGGGTDNHLLLVNLKNSSICAGKPIDGAKVERIMELINLAANKNTVPGDVSAMTPGGIRMGTPALTTRGFTENDFSQVANFFHKAVQITMDITNTTGPKLKDFKEYLLTNEDKLPEIIRTKKEVVAFARQFPTIGFS